MKTVERLVCRTSEPLSVVELHARAVGPGRVLLVEECVRVSHGWWRVKVKVVETETELRFLDKNLETIAVTSLYGEYLDLDAAKKRFNMETYR